MLQMCNQPCLMLKTTGKFSATSQFTADDFNGYITVHRRLAGLVNDCHPAFANSFRNFILAQPLPDEIRHTSSNIKIMFVKPMLPTGLLYGKQARSRMKNWY